MRLQAPPTASTRPSVEAWFERERARCRAAARLRADRRWALEPDLPGYATREGAAGRCGGRRSASGSARPTTWSREHRVVSALAGTPVPVAPVVGLCEDESRERSALLRDGVRRGPGPARPGRGRDLPRPRRPPPRSPSASSTPWSTSTRSTPTPSGSASSAARRTTSPASCTAGRDSGRSRRPASWRRSTRSTTRLAAAIPEQGPATIVHGDYRLDNMILTPGGEVAAVVDWELCTLGDPLADVGLLMVYWPDSGEEATSLGQPANLAPGFPGRDELRQPLRRALRPRPLAARLLRRPRLLEAGDHPRGRLRPLRGRPIRQGRRGDRILRTGRREPRGRRRAGVESGGWLTFLWSITDCGGARCGGSRALTYANVVSTLALFLVLSGGVAYAAQRARRKASAPRS